MFSFSVVTPPDQSFRTTLLSFDDVVVLADPFWDGTNAESARFMESHLKETQVILLSHLTPEFIGGYVLLCVLFPNLMAQIPAYCTLPVNQLGRIATVEYYRAAGILGPLQSAMLELDDVDEWFDRVNLVKFAQTAQVAENRIALTAYSAGHTLGGAFWLLHHHTERVVYAPAWNHSRDLFLNSAAFMTSTGTPLLLLLRPTALITSSDLGSAMPHKRRIDKFLALVDATLANGGAVLLPTSLSGRFLELFRLVDEHLQGAPIPVYFVSYLGTKILSYASNLLDWMSLGVLNEWDDDTGGADNRSLPFAPSKVDLLLDPLELVQLSGPKIVFCLGTDLLSGDMLTAAFRNLCQDEKTTVVITERSRGRTGEDIQQEQEDIKDEKMKDIKGEDIDEDGPSASVNTPSTLSSQLYEEWRTLAERKNGGKAEDGVAVPLEKIISIDDWEREEPMSGRELTAFQERIQATRRDKMMAKVRDRKNQNLLDADDDEDSTDDDEEEEIEAAEEAEAPIAPEDGGATTAAIDELAAHEAFVTDYIKQAIEQSQAIDLKVTARLKPRQAMFPYFAGAHKLKVDDYGAVIDANDYQKTDEVSNAQIIMEGKKKFEEHERKFGKRENSDDVASKLTPQEVLNNQLLQKNLETLFNPRKRVPMRTHGHAQLRMRCGLSFVDLAGLVDIRLLNMVVGLLRPYNLVLLPTTTGGDSTDGLAAVSRMFSRQQDEQDRGTAAVPTTSLRVFSLAAIRAELLANTANVRPAKMGIWPVRMNHTLSIGDNEELQTSALSNFEVKLDEDLVRSLQWQHIDGSHRVAHVCGALELASRDGKKDEEKKEENEKEEKENEETKEENEKENNKENEDDHDDSNVKRQRTLADYFNASTQYTLKKAMEEQGQGKLLDPKLAIGNIRLPELKKKLQARNLVLEFKSEGTLVVNDTLAIRKVAYGFGDGEDTGDVVIEGNVGPLYYEVKECIREMLAYF